MVASGTNIVARAAEGLLPPTGLTGFANSKETRFATAAHAEN